MNTEFSTIKACPVHNVPMSSSNRFCLKCEREKREAAKAETEAGQFRLEGKFVGGGWWESNRTFTTEAEAMNWYKEQNWTTPSTHVKTVKAV